jgi:hypothetical protein
LLRDVDASKSADDAFVPNESRTERKSCVNFVADFAPALHCCNTCAAIQVANALIACNSRYRGSRWFSLRRAGVLPVGAEQLWTN